MQIAWLYFTSHILSYRRLPWKQKRRCPNLLRFWCSIAKGTTIWLGMPLMLVFAASKIPKCYYSIWWDIYYLDCIWVASKRWILRIPMVGKVVVKVSHS